MKSLRSVAVLLGLLTLKLVLGQSVDTVWVNRFLATDPYGSDCHSSGRAMSIDGQGSVYVFWQGTDWISWSYCGLIKYSTDGGEIWVRYDLPGYLESWEPINIFYNP